MNDPVDRGLRAFVPAACRRALRAAHSADDSRQHLEACPFCASRLRAVEELGDWLSTRPREPVELRRPEMLDRIRERVIEHVEAGPVGAWLEQAAVAMPANAAPSSWQDAVVDGDRSDRGADQAASHHSMARELMQAPRAPEARVWSQVRRSILADITAAAHARARHNPLRWRILLAGVAASAVLGLFVLSEGTPSTPTIVFTELQRAPDLDFAVVRYGLRR